MIDINYGQVEHIAITAIAGMLVAWLLVMFIWLKVSSKH